MSYRTLPDIIGLALLTLLVGVVTPGCQENSGTNHAARPEAAMNSYIAGVKDYQSGDMDKAIVDLKKALADNENLTMARAMLGDIYRRREDYVNAVVQYDVLTKLDPYDYLNFYNLGLSYQFLNRLQESAVAYIKALKLNPSDSKTNMNLAMIYLSLGRADLAVTYSGKATQFDPKSAPAWVDYGVSLDSYGQLDKAEVAYRKALELDPDQPQIPIYLAENLLAQHKFNDARRTFVEVLKIRDDVPTRKLYGDVLLGNKDYDEAIKQYQIVLAAQPKNTAAMNGLGAALMGLYDKSLGLDEDKKAAALKAWQDSLAINPNQPPISDLLKKYSKDELLNP